MNVNNCMVAVLSATSKTIHCLLEEDERSPYHKMSYGDLQQYSKIIQKREKQLTISHESQMFFFFFPGIIINLNSKAKYFYWQKIFSKKCRSFHSLRNHESTIHSKPTMIGLTSTDKPMASMCNLPNLPSNCPLDVYIY